MCSKTNDSLGPGTWSYKGTHILCCVVCVCFFAADDQCSGAVDDVTVVDSTVVVVVVCVQTVSYCMYETANCNYTCIVLILFSGRFSDWHLFVIHMS